MDGQWRRCVTYFSSPRKLIAEEALLEERLAFNVASCNLSWSTAVKASSASALTILFTVGSLVACAGPEPILRSNTQLQLYGKEAAEREVGICEIKAERAGLQHGTNRSGNAGAGLLLGLVGGAAIGASTGLVGGPTGVAIGAAAGAAVGGVVGVLGGTYKTLEPRQEYAAFVERCLKEKGYETAGWQ